MKLDGQGGTNDGGIGACIQHEVVRTGMIDDHGHDNLVVVYESDG
jgi:hypothetical protein